MRSFKRSTGPKAKSITGLYADEIGIAHVRRAVQPMVDQGFKEAARRTQNHIEKVLDYAAEQGWRRKTSARRGPRSPESGASTRSGSHHAAIGWSELPDVIERIRTSDSMGARAFLFMILTATRVSEACEARWSEISFDKAIWSIPAERMKAGVTHDIPLSRQALAILAELKAHRTLSPFVFPGYEARQGISHIKSEGQPRALGRMAVWMLCRRVTEDRASPHGFRSTFRDRRGESGKPREHAERAIAHRIRLSGRSVLCPLDAVGIAPTADAGLGRLRLWRHGRAGQQRGAPPFSGLTDDQDRHQPSRVRGDSRNAVAGQRG